MKDVEHKLNELLSLLEFKIKNLDKEDADQEYKAHVYEKIKERVDKAHTITIENIELWEIIKNSY